MLRIAAVEYLNTLPFIYGLQQSDVHRHFEILRYTPVKCAEALKNNEVDIALLPVGAINDFDRLYVISDYCIGCNNEVRTVSVFSNFPLEAVKTIELDPSSRTSNLLLEQINTALWSNYQIELVKNNGQAKLIIGDAAFEAEKEYQYRFDLGKLWKEWTDLEFVFALWVAKDEISIEEIKLLNQAFKFGIENIDKLTSCFKFKWPDNMDTYYTSNISYFLDDIKKEGLKKFCNLSNLPFNKLLM